MSLTLKQKRVLDFIIGYDANQGLMPSYQEICDGVGLSSKSQVAWFLEALEVAGFITRQPFGIRSIQLTDKAKGNRGIRDELAIQVEALRGQLDAANREIERLRGMLN